MRCLKCGYPLFDLSDPCVICGFHSTGIEQDRVIDQDRVNAGKTAPNAMPVKNCVKGGFWRRLYAFGFDILFIRLLSLPLYLAVKTGFMTGAGIVELHYETFLDIKELFANTVVCLLCAAYFIYFHGMSGQTWGKRLFHLKVVRVDGRQPGYSDSIVRFIGYCISFIALNLGFLMIAFNPQKQGLHDIIANTYVIRTDKKL